jgi:hypothetical protein
MKHGEEGACKIGECMICVLFGWKKLREEDFATGYLAVGVGLDDVGRWGCSSESPKVCWLRGRACSGIQIVLEYEVIWGHIDILVVALRKLGGYLGGGR